MLGGIHGKESTHGLQAGPVNPLIAEPPRSTQAARGQGYLLSLSPDLSSGPRSLGDSGTRQFRCLNIHCSAIGDASGCVKHLLKAWQASHASDKKLPVAPNRGQILWLRHLIPFPNKWHPSKDAKTAPQGVQSLSPGRSMSDSG